MTSSQDTAPKAGKREWTGLALLVLPTFVVAIDIFVLMLALPSLSADLHAGSNAQLWVMDIYGFVLAGLLLTMGTLGDRIGKRRLMLIGAAIFGVASLLCAFSVSPGMLIASRALLGVGGAAMGPATLGLIFTLFRDPKQMAAAFGMWGSAFTLGAIIGPVIGGAMIGAWWWGSVFLIAVPVMALVLILGPKFLPEGKGAPGQGGKLDPISVVFSLGGLLLVFYGIKQLARDGWTVLPTVALVVGIVLAALFLRRQTRLAVPLLDLSIFRVKAVGTSLLGQLCYSSMGGALMFMMLLYFQLVQGMSPLQAGLAMVPGMVGGATGFMLAPAIAAKIRPAYVIAGGLTISALVAASWLLVSATSGTVLLIVGFFFFSLCGAPMAGLGVNIAISSAPAEKSGSTGSLAQMANEFGGTFGVAVFGTVAAAVYRIVEAGNIPSSLSGDQASVVGDSMAGATTVAAQVGQPLGSVLLGPAREAFTSGFNTVAGIATVIMLGAALLVVTRLRDIPPIGSEQAPAEVAPEGAPDEIVDDVAATR